MFTRYNVKQKRAYVFELEERLAASDKPRLLKTRTVEIPHHSYSSVQVGDVLLIPVEQDTGSEAWTTADLQHSPRAMPRSFPLHRRGA
ncbi:hypothetical protein pEaSNUABM11_00141 [Erwinia phage pEa_SNUABM_11]|nr:hypothetical protein pEaSNUABM11_00141 [Erwinia phage pEa_SNUABM_11]